MKTSIITAALLCIAASANASEQAHWSYSGAAGPEKWASLASDFALCGGGRNQSPVDLAGATDAALPAIEFRYRPGGAEIVNNGHTVQVNDAGGSMLAVGDRRYQLKQFHFHAPSENHIEGRSFALEAHLVHADEQGNLAVVAVMFERGQENTALASFWDQIPLKAGTKAMLASPVDAQSLLPVNHGYYRFSGSLTTPPCSEGVLWLVMKSPVSVSEPQVTWFSKAVGVPNNRPLQPLNARVILR